ncbi:MAG: hypothetical protein EAZ44_09330 [Cytophagia bacterium]|nr:MAG: hypothetical protein EAZ44_09330 [Cytophagia bacterium]
MFQISIINFLFFFFLLFSCNIKKDNGEKNKVKVNNKIIKNDFQILSEATFESHKKIIFIKDFDSFKTSADILKKVWGNIIKNEQKNLKYLFTLENDTTFSLHRENIDNEMALSNNYYALYLIECIIKNDYLFNKRPCFYRGKSLFSRFGCFDIIIHKLEDLDVLILSYIN